ncbi:OprO/OprP family phosphate-selective porin [Luteolibacter flavescens]|uniref:OprO/OprP family phosphate-selective porin n=1 Tax=Luteolibacter flavescens TaxID=1859460 RepID=A0ABT3FSU4_9BACT|nr:OprO/OprP family phosphate-selective porin [Luteolibacter flavescens]MCW1886622.1 OprO/OprP family phosphate-selective porin [Luteolibacter flavescens]
MKYQTTQVTAALLCGLSSLALAGDPVVEPAPAAESGSMFADFNFCDWLSSKPGTVKIPDNPWVQSLVFEGRYHWNAAYVDGEGTNGQDFSEDYTDARRFRLGGKIGFLNYFSYKGVVNMVDDQRFNGGELDYDYIDFDESYFTFDMLKAFNFGGLDALTANFGRIKWHGGLEARTSSNALLTVERSAISNKLYQSARPTGLFVNAVKGQWNVIAGIYSTDEGTDETGADDGNVEGWGGWNDGLMYNAEVIYSATEDLRLGWEFIYNNADERFANEDSLLDYRWATTVSAEYAIGNGGVNVEGFYGDNGGAEMQSNAARRGNFWGFVATPYYWIVPAKLQAVVQYAYAGAEENQGIRMNSRYVRATNYGGGGSPNVVNGGRGDSLHTIYAGLNYLVCGDNLKFQLGAEYAHLETPNAGDGDVEALTWMFGFRSFF